jgi:Chaperone of endosialidase
MNPLIQLKNPSPLILIALLLACLPLSPVARAIVPAPDGGYPGQNTAEGQSALLHLAGGTYNTTVGWSSLGFNVTGNNNTAIGAGALLANTADNNTATGAAALLSNTTGNANTANGAFALLSNTTGFSNTAIGVQTLFSNTIGVQNTANGLAVLSSNTNGSGNTANGVYALYQNTHGNSNTASGINALGTNTGGSINTAIGAGSLGNITSGNSNIALGFNAGSNLTSGDNNIYIGSLGVATESATIRIGTSNVQTRAFIRAIRGMTTGNNDAIPVLIDTAGQLGTTSSSRRFKKEIKPMDCASEALLALKPVTFHYESDKANVPQFGLIAEEVAEVNPDLVVRDEKGEIYTVRYDAVNAMLLNEFLKEHRKVEEQEKTIDELKSGMTALAATVKEQAAQIQKVSAQLEASKPAPQTVVNKP